ncbi:hypothetical protein SAMN02745119_00711 [Trichlorobacter thiogenes]|uniref:Cep192/Spd-2-like domain-containing protein n=1 Tax=Trichlorobacter thiogenes TaxID=115783 RepID=A0A1T4L0V4_9BACT|nr:choice-of-anchor D domain-containing protein [Trichlorobacter thiogenes]SJZ48335.1 hypothetical protein SAMN02745119_00711 [Trichlorobacter thiogenes]
MKQLSAFLFVKVLLLIFISPALSFEFPATPLGSDMMGVVTSSQWIDRVNNLTVGTPTYDSINQGFPITTDVNGMTNHEDWPQSIRTPNVSLQAGHAYQFVLRMKTDVFPRGQNIMVVARDAADSTQVYQFAWNASKAGEWEDVYVPVYPTKNGSWRLDVWVHPTIKYTSTPSTIYISPDVDCYELSSGNEIATLRPIDVSTDKDAFVSSTEWIDGLGNVYVKDGENWKHVFPRMMYRRYQSELGGVAFKTIFQRYKEYGFNGVMDIWDEYNAQDVMDAGLDYISIMSNSTNSDATVTSFESMKGYIDRVYNWATTNNRHGNLLWYNYDNENAHVADYEYKQSLQAYIDTYHLDPLTGKRRHPVYVLNGQNGLPRTYHNTSRNVMDLTGSYVGTADALGTPNGVPAAPRLLIESMTQNQRAPVAVIQLQTYFKEEFIPSLFYGIIMGGRALSVWRDGTTFSGSTADFRDNVWALAFKNDVSPKIDLMLPIIEQPHFTNWKAWTNQFPSVRIGTRELNGVGYLLLSSFAATDLSVTVTLQNRQATKAVDYFTGEEIGTVSNGQFTFTMGHYNNGYRVIRLVAPTAAAASPASNDYGTVSNGQTSSSTTFTLSNHSSATSSLQINSRTITGTNADQFILSNGSCGAPPFFLDPGGSCTVQVAFKPTTTGLKNATLAITSTDVNSPTLSVALSGTGRAQLNLTVSTSNGSGGTVTGDTSGISCTGGNCTYDFTQADTVNLTATANIASVFGGWSGACTNVSGLCTVTMSNTKTLGAAFNLVPRARIGTTPYGSLASAYAAVASNGLIQAKSLIFPDSGLSCNRNISFSLKGGYADTYSSQTGYSTISGKLTLAGSGTVTVDRIVIQ